MTDFIFKSKSQKSILDFLIHSLNFAKKISDSSFVEQVEIIKNQEKKGTTFKHVENDLAKALSREHRRS